MPLPRYPSVNNGIAMKLQRTRLFLLLLALPLAAHAYEVYMEPDNFIATAFDGAPPRPSTLWIKGDLKSAVTNLLGHPYEKLRVRYWRKDEQTAWILNEIGKEKPITTGIIIRQGQLKTIKVLIFRESRGWEVQYDFFTDQFLGARVDDKRQLDRHIDGISGATLSVNALTKQARLALHLDHHVTQN